jgi:hypothetical protein
MMDTSNIKMRWVFAALLAVFPVVGLICSISYHDISMLWVSLMGAAIAAVVFPVGFVLLYVVSQLSSLCIAVLLTLITQALSFRKK